MEQRVDNYKSTIANIKLPKKLQTKPRKEGSADGTDNFDVVFWFGDFNFLVTKERDKIEKKVKTLRELSTGANNYEDIINHDELSRVMSQDMAFKGFLEGRITFEPTYKYDVGSDTYDTSEKCRIPSYCVSSSSLVFNASLSHPSIHLSTCSRTQRTEYCFEVDTRVQSRATTMTPSRT